MNNNILKNLGLTRNESSVYLTCLKNKNKTAAELARILDIDKSSCYRAVESLVKKGLLITSPRLRGTTHSAAAPETLHELLLSRKNEFHTQEQELNKFINTLKREAKDNRTTYIKVQTGIQAIRDGMDANLEAALASDKIIKEQYRLSFPYFKDREHVAWVNEFARRRIKAGVSIRQIVDFAGSDAFAPIMKTDKSLLKEIHLMPPEMKTMHGYRTSGDLTQIISFNNKNDYIVITIHDRFVTQLMKSIFDFTWKHSAML